LLMILSYRQLTFEERIVIQTQLTLGLRPGRSLRVSAGRVRPHPAGDVAQRLAATAVMG
jgi:hypothetical protein